MSGNGGRGAAWARGTRLALAHEGRWLVSLGLWVARRQNGTGPGVRAIGYARAQAPLVYGFAFVCLVETVGMAYLLAGVPVVHEVLLFLDVYTFLMALGLHAAAVTRPHLLEPGALRVRHGARLDLRIPLERIASVRHDLRFPKDKAPSDVLESAVAGQTAVTLELSGPVAVVGPLGGRTEVRTVRFHADEPRAAVAAIRAALATAETAHAESGRGAGAG